MFRYHFALILLLSLAACGRGQKLNLNDGAAIVHGSGVRMNNGLSIVALVMENDEGQGLCTGTLLTEDTVLTAAHCVDHNVKKMVVVFGTRVRGTSVDHLRAADHAIQNPRWHQISQEGKGDLAIVHFKGGLPAGYQPVQLASHDLKLANGQAVMMAGYGVSNGLRNSGAGQLRSTQSEVLQWISKTEVASDGRKSSVCFGDSGGPAFVESHEGLVQWGVASSVLNQACNEASVHTAVMPYEGWISKTVAKLQKGPLPDRK